jgi:hypothetical protein
LLTGLVLLVFALLSVRAATSRWPTSLNSPWRHATARVAASSPIIEPRTEHVKVVCRRMRSKDAVAHKVLSGEMGLLEAATWFGYFNEMPPEQPDMRWRSFPGSCDSERLCRQVIRYVDTVAATSISPFQRDRRVSLLEEELAEHLARHGTVELAGFDSPAQ